MYSSLLYWFQFKNNFLGNLVEDNLVMTRMTEFCGYLQKGPPNSHDHDEDDEDDFKGLQQVFRSLLLQPAPFIKYLKWTGKKNLFQQSLIFLQQKKTEKSE